MRYKIDVLKDSPLMLDEERKLIQIFIFTLPCGTSKGFTKALTACSALKVLHIQLKIGIKKRKNSAPYFCFA